MKRIIAVLVCAVMLSACGSGASNEPAETAAEEAVQEEAEEPVQEEADEVFDYFYSL